MCFSENTMTEITYSSAASCPENGYFGSHLFFFSPLWILNVNIDLIFSFRNYFLANPFFIPPTPGNVPVFIGLLILQLFLEGD